MTYYDTAIASINLADATHRLKVNAPRARAVLEEMDLDGMIALKPINVYYLTNTMPVLTKFRYDFAALATFPRNYRETPFLICSAAQSWDVCNGDRETPQTIVYTRVQAPKSNTAPSIGSSQPEGRAIGYAVDEGADLTTREKGWIGAEETSAATAAIGLPAAVLRALRESGLDRGRIAVDDMRIPYLLHQAGLTEINFVPGEDVFRRIRMVKTEPELVLQGIAGRNNAEAAVAAMRSLEKGMRFSDIEQLFRLECARRGNDMASLLAGMSIGGFPDGEVVEGKPFLIDAVSSFSQYMGDFGRTVVLGEPKRDLKARVKANKVGRDAVFEMIRPGIRFSQIVATARHAQIKAGMPADAIIVNPHSVGLEHGDNPGRPDVPFNEPIDIVLEENMVLTVDMPYLEIGWGAGHNEDLIRITRTGFEPLHDITEPLIAV